GGLAGDAGGGLRPGAGVALHPFRFFWVTVRSNLSLFAESIVMASALAARGGRGLPHRFAHRHGGCPRAVERAQAFSHRKDEPRVGGRVPLLGHARRFAAEQQDVAAPERVREIGAARARGEENEPRTGAGAPSLERLPVDVTDDLDLIEVI